MGTVWRGLVVRAGGGDSSGDENQVETTILTEILGISILVANLIFSFLLAKLEPWAERRHPYVGMTVRVLYKELMSLGFISLIFTFVEISAKPPSDVVHAFEFAHIFLFMLAFMNVVVVGGTTYTSLRISRRWKKFQYIETIEYEEDKLEFEGLSAHKDKHQNFFWTHFFWIGLNLARRNRYYYLHEEMNFHDLRIQFLHQENLPSSFNFSKYMRHIKSTLFVDLVEIKPSIWFFLLVVFAVDCIRRIFYTSPSYDYFVIIVCTYVDLVAVFIIYIKIRRIYWELTKNPGLYFEADMICGDSMDEDEMMILRAAEEKQAPMSDIQTSRSSSMDSREPAQGHGRQAPTESPQNTVESGTSGGKNKEFVDGLFSKEQKFKGPPKQDRDDKPRMSLEFEAKKFIGKTRTESAVTTTSDGGLSFSDERGEGAGSNRADSAGTQQTNGLNAPVSLRGGRKQSEVGSEAGVNKSLHDRAMETKEARVQQTNYPYWLTLIIPRLKRKACPAEKLFWFGSSHFFAWISQMTLFSSVILMSLVLTAIIFEPPDENIPSYQIVMIVSVFLAGICIQFVIAFLMKKYTIVLVAAQLVDEELSTVLKEESLRNTLVDDFDDDSSVGRDDESSAAKSSRLRDRFFFLGFMRNRHGFKMEDQH